MTTKAPPVLAVEHLTTRFATRHGEVTVVDDVSFTLRRGEVLGLVGESGSGKSMTGFSLLGMIDPPGYIAGGSVRLDGRELLGQSAHDWRALRGNRMAMVFQDPMMTLNPVLRVETQMIEAVRAHRDVSRAEARERAFAALGRVGIASPRERLRAWPHELSGGMRQRVAIAIALLNEPAIIIADEPTTALDVTIQGQILFEMQALARDSGTALLWITHDLAVVAGLADRVAVMYAGRIVEQGSTAQVLEQTAHPYTQGLLASTPAAQADRAPGSRAPLQPIPGNAPSLAALPTGCAFRPRCPRASAACEQVPQVQDVGEGEGGSQHLVRCFHPLHGGRP